MEIASRRSKSLIRTVEFKKNKKRMGKAIRGEKNHPGTVELKKKGTDKV